MKQFINYFQSFIVAIYICFLPSLVNGNNFEVVFKVDTTEQGIIFANKKNDVLFQRSCPSYNGGGGISTLFYINPDLGADEINITEYVSNQLLQLGYYPKSFSMIGKPWEANYSLDYDIRFLTPSMRPREPIDEFGNVLLLFTEEGKFLDLNHNAKKWLYKLGVWHKDYGFKVIDTREIEDVKPDTFAKGDYLYVIGSKANGQDIKILVISIKDGYWDERRQAEPEPVKEEFTSEKSWWDKNKPLWWP